MRGYMGNGPLGSAGSPYSPNTPKTSRRIERTSVGRWCALGFTHKSLRCDVCGRWRSLRSAAALPCCENNHRPASLLLPFWREPHRNQVEQKPQEAYLKSRLHSAMIRFLAIGLAFLIGCPFCWCCALKPLAQHAVVHECCCAPRANCPASQSGGTSKHSSHDSCDCDLGKTQREAHHAAVALPPLPCVIADNIFDTTAAPLDAQGVEFRRPQDKGPPRGGTPPLYVRLCVLRL